MSRTSSELSFDLQAVLSELHGHTLLEGPYQYIHVTFQTFCGASEEGPLNMSNTI